VAQKEYPTSVSCSLESHQLLKAIATALGVSMQEALSIAVDQLGKKSEKFTDIRKQISAHRQSIIDDILK